MMAQVNAGRVRFVGRGEYNNSTQYYVFDLVSYNGNSYYAKADTIGHLPTDTTYWQLVAEKGNVGPTGLTGNGISSIEKTSTSGLVDTYTITYTNGNTTTFNVSNGNGIDRIEKTATVGNKDTYTIYFTNGSTTTYEVSNGEVTREELEEEVERLSMIYNAFPSTTGEGEEPSINGTAEVPFKEIGLKGNTSQNGEPTPDTPIPVNVVTGDNDIKVEGKNLVPFTNQDFTLNNVRYYVENGSLILNGTSTGEISSVNTTFKTNFSFTLPSGTYTISHKTGIMACYLYKTDNTLVKQVNTNVASETFTLSEETQVFLGFYIYQKTFANINAEVMIEKGTPSSEYQPYQSQTYPINLGSMELCKIGDYQDYIYKDSGKWYLHKEIGKFDLSTISFWNKQANGNFYNMNFAQNNGYISGIGLSNLFNYSTTSWVDNCFGITSAGVLWIATSDTTITSYDEFITWLDNKNAIMYGALATPTITEITDTTLIEQLDNLEKAYSYDTQTNISQTNQDKPFIISYEAILSLRNVLNS